MASRQSLQKIGEEAFRLIDHPAKPTVHYIKPPQVSNAHRADHFYPRPSPLPPASQNRYHVQLVPAPVADREDYHGGAMDCYEAARRFGGVVVTEYKYPNRNGQVKRNNMAY